MLREHVVSESTQKPRHIIPMRSMVAVRDCTLSEQRLTVSEWMAPSPARGALWQYADTVLASFGPHLQVGLTVDR